jgi:hypothetical protein
MPQIQEKMDLTMLKAEEDRLFDEMYDSERLKKEQRYAYHFFHSDICTDVNYEACVYTISPSSPLAATVLGQMWRHLVSSQSHGAASSAMQ